MYRFIMRFGRWGGQEFSSLADLIHAAQKEKAGGRKIIDLSVSWDVWAPLVHRENWTGTFKIRWRWTGANHGVYAVGNVSPSHTVEAAELQIANFLAANKIPTKEEAETAYDGPYVGTHAATVLAAGDRC